MNPRLILSSSPCNCSWFPLCVSRLTPRSYPAARVWRRARSPYQWQQSSVINKLRIFFALICLEAFFYLAPAETCLAVTAPLLPCLIGLEGNRDKYTLRRGVGEGWMREEQVMKSFQNHPFNFFHCAVETSRIPLAWSIMGGSESLCDGVWINFLKH